MHGGVTLDKADPVLGQPDHAVMPAAVTPDQLCRRKRVEEFVRNAEQGGLRRRDQRVRVVMPDRLCRVTKGLFLRGAQHRARLDKMHRCR